MVKEGLLEYIATVVGVDYVSDLRLSPHKERALILYENIKDEYSEEERIDASNYLEIKE